MRFVATRSKTKLWEHRIRERAFDDGYAKRPAAMTLLIYQRSYLMGVNARNAADEQADDDAA